jgi:hypothetical protein
MRIVLSKMSMKVQNSAEAFVLDVDASVMF